MSKEYLTALSQRLADSGKLIEAGWISLRIAAMPADATELQIAEMRKAFMAGAAHLFSSIISCLDEGGEITDRDMRRMALIQVELDEFCNQLHVELAQTVGNA
jgi:hypothetical protein